MIPSQRRRRNKNQEFRINLTSMMSLFSILIVFMLKNFSTQPDLVTPSKQLKLPTSTALKAPTPALKLMLTADVIMIEDKILVDIESVRKQEDLLIKPLFDALEAERNRTELIAKINKKLKFKGEILLQCDKNIDFSIVKKVMYTSGQVGFETIYMVVISKE